MLPSLCGFRKQSIAVCLKDLGWLIKYRYIFITKSDSLETGKLNFMTSFFTGFYLLTKRHKFFPGCMSRELSAPRRWHPSLLCQNVINTGTLRRKMPWMLLGMQCRSRVHRFFNSSALSIQKGKIGQQQFLPSHPLIGMAMVKPQMS